MFEAHLITRKVHIYEIFHEQMLLSSKRKCSEYVFVQKGEVDGDHLLQHHLFLLEDAAATVAAALVRARRVGSLLLVSGAILRPKSAAAAPRTGRAGVRLNI